MHDVDVPHTFYRVPHQRRTAGFVMGVGLAIAACVDLLYWLEGSEKVLLLRESHFADMVALAGIATLACLVTERTYVRLLVLLPAALYAIVHGWHMLAAANILDELAYMGDLSTSGVVLTLPADDAARFSDETASALNTIGRLRVAHLVAAGLACLCSCAFAAHHRRPQRLSNALGMSDAPE